MKKINYNGRCGTCQMSELILGTRACYCKAIRNEPNAEHAPGHPYPIHNLSHAGCKLYKPFDYTDGSIERDVLAFIGRFSHEPDRVRQEVVKTFTSGCCFWFARILVERFFGLSPEIMVDYSNHHFGTRIHGRVYDITGDVTEEHNWEPWEECNDASLAQRISEECIMF